MPIIDSFLKVIQEFMATPLGGIELYCAVCCMEDVCCMEEVADRSAAQESLESSIPGR